MPESGRLALFIGRTNLYSTARALGFDIDFRKLLAVFQERGRLLRAFYYTPVFEDQEGSSTRPLQCSDQVRQGLRRSERAPQGEIQPEHRTRGERV